MAIDKSDYRQVFAAVFTHAEESLLNAKHHPDALNQYLESWQKVAEQAAKLDNLALQDVVSLFIDATDSVFKTHKNSYNLTDAHWQLLKKWNGLFAAYINAADNQQLALALIQCLNDPLLAMDLSSEDEKVLLESFLPVIRQLNVNNKQDVIANGDSQKQPLSVWEKLTVLLAETDIIFQELLKQNNQNNEKEYTETVKQYLESWKVVVEFIEAEQNELLLKILDIISLLIEFSCQLFNQTDRLNSEQQGALRQWHNLFASYIKVEGSQQLAVALVRLLTNPVWLQPLSGDDEKMLLSEFQTQNTPSSELSSTQRTVTQDSIEPVVAINATETETAVAEFSNAKIETVLQQPEVVKKRSLWQQLESYFNETVPHLKSAAEQQLSNDEAALKNSLQQYLENWLALAQQIELNGERPGLLDVVLLYIEVSRQTFGHLESFERKHITLLNKWQSLFGSYLKAKGNRQLEFSLVKCLRDPLWQGAIEAEDEEMLLAGFTPSPALQPKVEHRVHLTEQTTSENELNLLAQVEKNPLWQKIALFFEDTQSQLPIMQNLLAANNNQACHSYFQQYAEHWRVIAEIIAEESESFDTLADMTFLFADNCAELLEQNYVLTQNHLQLFHAWSTAFAVCLQNISTVAQTGTLIACLENALWLRPLTVIDKEMLLAMLSEQSQYQPVSTDEGENLLMFNQGMFCEDEGQDFALFAEEDYQQPVTLTETEKSTAEPESVMFANEELEANESEDFVLFAEDFESDESAFTITTEESVAESSVIVTADLQSDTQQVSTHCTDTSIADEKTTQPTTVNPELIGMVRDEFDLWVKEFNLEINGVVEEDVFKVVLKNHIFKLENLAKACNTIGLLGLEQIFEHLSFNMRCRRDIDGFNERQSALFKTTLPLIQNHLAAMTQRDKAVALVIHLSAEGWTQPLTKLQTQPLIKLLTGLVLSSHNQQLDNRKTLAELADISLELPDDVNSELLDSLLNELPILTNNFSAVIQKIISDDRDLPQLREAQRIAHTLKGSGNIVGVTGIAVLTHHLEEILEYLSKRETFPTKALGKVLLESADCLEMMSDLMLNNESEPPEQALQVLQNVLNWANQIAAAGLPAEDSELETTTLPAQPDTGITSVVKETKAVEAIAMTRVPSEKIDQLLRMTGEGNILNEQFKERINRFSEELKVLNDLTWHIQSLVSELDQSINIQSYSTKSGRSGVDNAFDTLEMEQYNELHTAASRISEAATDIRETNIRMDQQLVELKYLMMEEDAIQKENQEMVQSIRMVAASSISSRCQRIVRQACRATNKEVELEIKGADILIDSEILNDMVEPLMHLLRNSIDHGIEPLHIREKFNKPNVGKITLEFSRKVNYAVITCKDDGGGLASGNILQTAIKKGLISAKQQLTEAEIHKLILIPGFSTRTVATQTSGRGIGMDAIQTKISSIQGQMSLFSARNEGLTIEITIPLTLSSMLSLLVRCGGQTMAISNRGLRKIHHADECTVILENGQLYCDIDNKHYPGKYFSELVGIPITYSAEQKLQGLRIEDEIGRTHIVFVEELLGYRDLLVKNMGGYIPHIQGITGASILGNGDVAPVIDLVEMLHHAAKYDYVLADASKALADSINGLPVALVVDDSLSARRAVAMLLKDSGLEVETAIDGLDAIKKIEKTIPDIILVDLEMPRMNGIELTAHVRGREDMKNVPIIMITSRATEKHRKQAEAAGVTRFMTKPFTEDDLIHNVRILMN